MYDLIIIGAGPGGYVAAIRAAQLKLKVAIIEKEHLGGICLNYGCIPTKALLRSAEIYDNLKHASNFGITAKDISFDIAKVVERSRAVSSQLSGGIKHLLKKNKVDVFMSYGKLLGNGFVMAGEQKLQSKSIIIATGARPRSIPGFEVDGELVWSYKEAMLPKKTPKSLVIVGSGAIGIEFASFYNSFGVDVTVLEAKDRILPNEDSEISKIAHAAFTKKGIKIFTSVSLDSFIKKDKVLVKFNKKEEILADHVIMATGIVANTENIGLENTKVILENGLIKTDRNLMTEEPNVYAIGDVTYGPWLAHKASHEGILCVNHIAGKKVHHLSGAIPGCTYSNPQIASIGITEDNAKSMGYEIKVGRFPFNGNGKAIALGEPDGLIKTIFDAKTGELLGAHMIGAEVTELIQGLAIAKSLEATEEEIMNTIFPHPTLSEMIHESTLDAYGIVIHK